MIVTLQQLFKFRNLKKIIMKYLIILLFSFTTDLVLGELVLTPNEQCGTVLTAEHRAYLANTREQRESLNLQNFRAPAEGIQIMAHVLVQDINAPSGFDITEDEIDASIDILNEYFVQVGLHFRRCLPINYVSEDQDYPETATMDIYPNTSRSEADIIIQDHGIPRSINVIFTPVGGGNCGFCTYPGESIRYIVMGNNCLNGPTFAHEMGHYFNLLHTFDALNGFTENVARPNDDINVCPPDVVDCSNCGPGVGDELCDTPADPHKKGLGTFFTNENGFLEEHRYNLVSCIIFGSCILKTTDECIIRDSNTHLYKPDITNIMSYAGSCTYYFSPQQIDRMRATLLPGMGNADLLNNHTDFDGCLNCPANINIPGVFDVNTVAEYEVSNSITSDAVLSPDVRNPDDGTLVEASANVTYDAGAFICLNPGFNANYTSNFLAIIDGCRGEFKTGEPELSQNLPYTFEIYPNPFSEQCLIDFNLVQDNAVTVSVSDLMGKKIATVVNNKQKVAGKHQVNFDGNNLPAGIYYCTIQAGNHIKTQKMVLTK